MQPPDVSSSAVPNGFHSQASSYPGMQPIGSVTSSGSHALERPQMQVHPSPVPNPRKPTAIAAATDRQGTVPEPSAAAKRASQQHAVGVPWDPEESTGSQGVERSQQSSAQVAKPPGLSKGKGHVSSKGSSGWAATLIKQGEHPTGPQEDLIRASFV